MPAIIILMLVGVGWVVAAVVFEGGFRWAKKNGAVWFSKGNGCRVWWFLMALFSTTSGPVAFLVGLPVLLAVSLSQICLANTRNEDEIITVAEIARNVGPALRQAATKIRPFLK